MILRKDFVFLYTYFCPKIGLSRCNYKAVSSTSFPALAQRNSRQCGDTLQKNDKLILTASSYKSSPAPPATIWA